MVLHKTYICFIPNLRGLEVHRVRQLHRILSKPLFSQGFEGYGIDTIRPTMLLPRHGLPSYESRLRQEKVGHPHTKFVHNLAKLPFMILKPPSTNETEKWLFLRESIF